MIRVKNRFLQPTAAGYRDILINAMLEHIGPSGRPTHFICEFAEPVFYCTRSRSHPLSDPILVPL